MAYRQLFIWVEGDDDARLMEQVKQGLFGDKYDWIVVRQYAQEKPDNVSAFLKSIKAMGADLHLHPGPEQRPLRLGTQTLDLRKLGST